MRSHCKQSKVNPTVELLELLRESWSKNEFARKRMLHRLLWIGSNRPFRNWTTSSLSFFLVRGAKRPRHANVHARDCRPRFPRLSTLARAWTPLSKFEEKEKPLAVYSEMGPGGCLFLAKTTM